MNFRKANVLHRCSAIGILLLCLQLMFCLQSTAQSTTLVSGTVENPQGEKLSGVSVQVVGSAKVVTTDVNGAFTITAATDAKLKLTHVGYKAVIASVSGLSTLKIVLQQDDNKLGEVVVTGYSTQRRKDVSGAIATVNMSDLDSRKVPAVAQALQGQVAGVQVTQSTGAPGDPIKVVIRGESSINSDTGPLYVVDGNPLNDISFLNPADILSMTVLKDAAASSLYGARASGGVIVITTKSGKQGKSSFDMSYYHGIQQVTHLPKMLNSTQYMDKMIESWNNSALFDPAHYTGTNPYTIDKGRSDFANTDWLKELFTLGQTDNVQASVAGGSDKIQYYMSGGYYHQNGIVVYNNDQYSRLNFRTNINAQLTNRFKVGTNLQIVNSMQDAISSSGDAPGIIRHAFIRPPVIPVYKDKTDPTYKDSDPFTDLPFYSRQVQQYGSWSNDNNRYELSSNPIALAYFTNDKRGNFRLFGNVFGEYAFLKNKELRFKSNLGVDIDFIHNKAFNKNFGDDDGNGDPIYAGQGRQNRPNTLTEYRGQTNSIVWTNTATYNKQIGLHSINALLGSEYVSYTTSWINGSRENFANSDPAFQYLDFGNQELHVWNGGTIQEWALFSLFGGVNYNYDNRYYASVNLRRDASSQFAADKQVAYFPSFSAAWRISQENFFKDVKAVSDLKLRISSGQLGNQSGLANYPSVAIYDAQGTLKRLGNPDLKWETTTQNDIGLDAAFLNNKLTLSVDYFQKTTSDLLLPVSLPNYAGDLQPSIINAGKLTNKGFEATVGYRNSEHAFKYAVNANIASVNNKVNSLYTYLPNITGQVTRTEAGHPINSYYGLEMVGIYQNQKDINSTLKDDARSGIFPGYVKFRDVNGDSVINDKDRVYLGNPSPRLTFGFNFSAAYKAFDIALFLQGVQGVERWNDLKRIIDYDTRPFNHSTNTLNAWHGEGTSNTIPVSTFTDNGSSFNSSIYVEDASYLRLKNLEIGYSLQSIAKKYKDNIRIRLYVSMQNLFTITKYTGLDPETLATSANNFIDQGTYPQSRMFLFGVNFKF